MRFRDFAEYAKRTVEEKRRTFTDADDDWPITVIADFGNEQPHPIEMPGWISNIAQAKEAFTQAMVVATRELKPTKLALICSTWMYETSAEERKAGTPYMRASLHPDRFEAVFVVVADAEIEEGHTARIKRRRYGPPLLEPWDEVADGVAGAMFEPWREALR